MLRRLLDTLQSAIINRPWTVILGSLVLVVVAVGLGSRVEFRTSRNELAPGDDPDQARWNRLLEDYSGSESLIACVEAIDPQGELEDLHAFTDQLASELRDDPLIAHVFHKLDTDWFIEHGLYLLPPERLRQIERAIDEAGGALIDDLASLTDFAALNRLLASRIESGLTSAASIPAGQGQVVEFFVELLRAQRELLEDPDADVVARIAAELLAEQGAAGLADGYVANHEHTTFFVFISPRSTDDSLEAWRELVAAVRQRVATASGELPGFTVALTGQPAIVVEEMDTVRRDTLRTSMVAAIGVCLLTLLVFRWRSHALLVLIALAVGIIWSFGAVELELGYLNVVASAFIPTLVGIGVAYGIHPVSEYELEGAHTSDPRRTVRESFRRTGGAIVVAAVTTSAAFFSILLMRFRGFAELGLIAGFGVLLCLLAATVTLPALLVVHGRWRQRRDRHDHRRTAPVVDRFVVERIAGRLCRFPRIVAAAALALTALMAWLALGIRFDTNLLDLLPRNAESLEHQRRMALESDLSPLFNLVVTDDLGELAAMRARAESEPAVSRFQSVLDFLPQDESLARSLMLKWRERLDGVDLPRPRDSVTRTELVDAYRVVEAALAQAAESAFGAGLGELVGPLEAARSEAQRCAELGAADATDIEKWNQAQHRLLLRARRALETLHKALGAEPPSLDNLPREIRQRFMTRSGRLLGFIYPEGNVFEPSSLDAFVAASRRVSVDATGFPLLFHKMARRITTGFYRSIWVGTILVALILLLDLRRLDDALLALLPLAMGMIWMLGGMRLLGLSFNFANLVAIPLIIGVGIDNGVHVIHRVRLERSAGMDNVLRHTGRAILIASLTTMIGFGSLSLASHRGMSSLGVVLLLGVGSCLLTSLLVLPNLLVALGRVER